MYELKTIQSLIENSEHLLENASNFESINTFKEAISLMEEHAPTDTKETSHLRARAYCGITTALLKLKNPEANKYAEKSLEIALKSEDRALEATSILNLGILHLYTFDLPNALDQFKKAISIFEGIGNISRIPNILNNIGNIYMLLSDYPKALEYYSKALEICENLNDNRSISLCLGNIGNVYSMLSDYKKALEFYLNSLKVNKEHNLMETLASNYGNIGTTYAAMSDYDHALEYLEVAFQMYSDKKDQARIAITLNNMGGIYEQNGELQKAIENYEYTERIFRQSEDWHGLCYSLIRLGSIFQSTEPANDARSEEKLLEVLKICKANKFSDLLAQGYMYLAQLYQSQERWELAFHHFKLFHDENQKIYNLEASKQADNYAIERSIQEKEKVDAVERASKEVRFQATEALLHRVMPGQIANRMLEGEQTIADSYEEASIFFSDIVGFTQLSASIKPTVLVNLLNDIFREFDRIAAKYGVEKIKTIGDAYMAVAGVPNADGDHAYHIAQFAIEVADVMKTFQLNNQSIQLRIGLHSGEAVAGVIGESKFAYDLWGDAVNVAARMEHTGEAGRIHVSEAFKLALERIQESRNMNQEPRIKSQESRTKNQESRIKSQEADDIQFKFQEREEIEVKGKGLMKTYFLYN